LIDVPLLQLVEADNQIVIGCSITENADEFAADLVGSFLLTMIKFVMNFVSV